MSTNVFGGRQTVVFPKQTINVVSTGINETNVNVIYLMGAAVKSYVPGRQFNGFSQFVFGQGYIIDAKVDIDLEEYLSPPFPTGNSIVTETGDPILPE